MKKILFTLFALFLGLNVASAQLGIHVRVEAGASLSKVNASFSNLDLGTSSATGYRVGAAIELPIAPLLYISPGVALRSNSVKYSPLSELLNVVSPNIGSTLPLGSLLDLGSSNNNSYIIVPLNLGFKLGIGGLGILAEVGPYAGYALNGSPISELGSDFKRFSYGVGASVALRMSSTYFKVGYEHELSKKFDIKSSSKLIDNNFKFNDSGFYFTIGQRF